jgi:DNA-directed RNA polymerase sigma subunit (sigma70/sigma32)
MSFVLPEARDGLTYAEIADLLGISRSRVQQIEHRALRKLGRVIAKRRAHNPEFLESRRP